LVLGFLGAGIADILHAVIPLFSSHQDYVFPYTWALGRFTLAAYLLFAHYLVNELISKRQIRILIAYFIGFLGIGS
jgi:hypothetical protein